MTANERRGPRVRLLPRLRRQFVVLHLLRGEGHPHRLEKATGPRQKVAVDILSRRVEVPGVDEDGGTALLADVGGDVLDIRLGGVPAKSEDGDAVVAEPASELFDDAVLLYAQVEGEGLTLGAISPVETEEEASSIFRPGEGHVSVNLPGTIDEIGEGSLPSGFGRVARQRLVGPLGVGEKLGGHQTIKELPQGDAGVVVGDDGGGALKDGVPVEAAHVITTFRVTGMTGLTPFFQKSSREEVIREVL